VLATPPEKRRRDYAQRLLRHYPGEDGLSLAPARLLLGPLEVDENLGCIGGAFAERGRASEPKAWGAEATRERRGSGAEAGCADETDPTTRVCAGAMMVLGFPTTPPPP
jgi:hypothetical protein